MTIHVGILGGGNISRTHARAASEIEGVKVVAIGGHNREKVEQLAATHQACACTDVPTFFQHRPMDMVLIGSPSGLHAAQGIQAARQGLHVLVEKPIAINTQQTDQLIAECANAGVQLGVFFQDRTAPDSVRLKQWLAAEQLGKPFLVSARVKWYRPPSYYSASRWRGTQALDGGGALMNQGVHTIDLLLWLMGGIRKVYAKAITALHNIEVEDTLIATLEFANGAIGTLEATTSVYPGYARRLELTGSQGTVIMENDLILAADLRQPLKDFLAVKPEPVGERAVSPTVSDSSGHRRVIEDFVQALATGRPPLCNGQEARRSVEVVTALYQSSQTGEAVTLPSSE